MVSLAFSGWYERIQFAQRARAVVARTLGRIQHGAVASAYVGWREWAVDEARERRHMTQAASLEDSLSSTESKLTAALFHNEELQARLEAVSADLQSKVDKLKAQLKATKRAQQAAESEAKRIKNLHETNRHGSLGGASTAVQRSAMRAKTPKRRSSSKTTATKDATKMTEEELQLRAVSRARYQHRVRAGPCSNDRGVLSAPLPAAAADAWY
jgi:hypothetical protein